MFYLAIGGWGIGKAQRRLGLGAAFCVALLAASGGCGRQQASDNSSSAQLPQSTADGSVRSPSTPIASRDGSLGQIRRLIAIGDLTGAEGVVQSHLVRHPNDPEAMMLGAQIDARQGQVDQAVAMLDGAASVSADDPQRFKTQAALLLARSARWQQAIERLEALVQERPESDEARQTLADLLNLRGFRFDANQHVRVLCERHKATLDQLRGLIAPSRSHTGFAEKPDIGDQAAIDKYGTLNVARGLYGEGDVTEAYELLKPSELVRQENPEAFAFYGQVLLEAQQFDEFETWLKDASPACQRYPAYWLALGGWAMRGRNHQAAVRLFAEAIVREPGDLLANDRMTQALAAAGYADASEKFRQRSVEIDQLARQTAEFIQDPDGDLKSIGQISQLLGQMGRPTESLEWLRIALERMGSPADAMRQYREGVAESQKSEFQESTRQTQLCGLDLDKLPLDDSIVAVSQVPSSASVPSALRDQPAARPPSLVNLASSVGLDFRYRNAKLPVQRELLMFQQIGAGVACFDYDLDGRVDLYVGQGAGDPPDGQGTEPNLLSRNMGDRFQDVTRMADCDDRNYTSGVTAGDWNQDGFLDLVVANLQRNTLLINQGDGTFLTHPGDTVWNQAAYTASVAIADVNGDHLPDIVEVNYFDDPQIFDPVEHHPDGSPIRLPAPLHFQPAVDRVFLSQGDGSLRGRTLGDPAEPVRATGLGVVITDIDGDTGNEIFIANDHMANHFWELQKDSGPDPHWQNTAAVRGVAYGTRGTPLGSMGIASADFDENGRVDFHVTNFESQWSSVYMQNDAGFFADLVVAYGLAEPTYEMVGFGTQAIDYDNNSVIDLVIGNGHIDSITASGNRRFEMPTQVFVLDGSRFQLLEVVGDDGYWKFDHVSRAMATCDWNRDGRMDLVTTDLNQPFALLENRTDTRYHWLQLQLVGTRSERDAIGATITASDGERKITKVVQAGDGYMCKNEPFLSFGLGEQTSVARLEIRWPDGQLQVLTNLAADRRWLVIEGQEQAFELQP